ncbi:MAG TPA: ShlB/FhaC/HecB family hemolysin secretion/activation protein [Lacunisphaera sp.]|nr:ShlB/FhaC/HecB family hemolysin secretion/activation protein [Lacunisphaera sp.]
MVASAPVGDAGVVIDHFEFRYGLAHPALPPLEQLNGLTIQATRDGNVFRAPSTKGAENLTLSGIPEGSRFDSGALLGIAQDVVRWYNARGLYGVWVAFSDLESSPTGLVDNRPADNHTAHLVIWASQVAEVRTLARGKRFKPQFSVNNPKHRRLIAHSPLHPGATPDQPGSLFRQDVLNDYLHGLSQHPGRLVEASIASAGEPGKLVLDYLVNESKPWQIFSQVNNFGTAATGQWRGRLGYQNNQLTNHDDILNVDVISTPNFKTYGSFLSYRIPVFRPAKLLARVYGSYGDFLASDAALQNLHFAGKNWLIGTEFTNRLSLPNNWQLVSAFGANYDHYAIESRINTTPLVSGFSNFLVPFIGTTLTKDANWWSLAGSVRLDGTVGNFANTDRTNGISALGRIAADSAWTSLRWSAGGTVYLEPLFQDSDKYRYLANAVSLSVRGRKLLRGSRLIPHEEEPIGGALSVRGYTESVLAADEFVIGSFEYALHIPHMLQPGDPGTLFKQPFKWRPVKSQQNPDWDLIFRAFYDYAHRQVTPAPLFTGQITSGPLSLVDRTLNLKGAGAGVELVVRQNFSLRCDVAKALTELRDDTRPTGQEIVVPAGQMKYYLVSSFSW